MEGGNAAAGELGFNLVEAPATTADVVRPPLPLAGSGCTYIPTDNTVVAAGHRFEGGGGK